MIRAFTETLQCSNTTVLERQRSSLKWQHPQSEQQESYNSDLIGVFSTQTTTTTHVQGLQDGLISGDDSVFDDSVMTQQVKPHPGLETAWPELGVIGPCANGFEMNYGISRTSSFPLAVAAATVATEVVLVKGKETAVGRECFKKRKADKLQNSKVVADDESKNIKARGKEDGESKITGQPNTKKETSAENPKVQKPDYIHVRARRGQATDSHSLAERARREKISERMKHLQDLVPGCNKITGKAGMLDEIINYVQSLQRQVEFLSMKLAAVNPRLDFNIIDHLGMQSEMANPPCVQFNQVQQLVSCSGVEMGLNSPDVAPQRTISAPVAIPDAPFLDQQFAMEQFQPDVELQTVYNVAFDHGRSTIPFPSQPYPGFIEASHLKMEM